MEIEKNHWTSEQLTIFGIWLWNQEEYGYALLCIHGPQWGYKIGQQLKITWKDILVDTKARKLKNTFDVLGDEGKRTIFGIGGIFLKKALEVLDIKNFDDSIYKNYRTGKPLSTSTLNRELQSLTKKFKKELKEKTNIRGFHLIPLKSNAFQIAWAIKTVERYSFSKKSFIEVSKFMGHRTLKSTISLLKVEPKDNIIFDFKGFDYLLDIDKDILNNEQILDHHFSKIVNVKL